MTLIVSVLTYTISYTGQSTMRHEDNICNGLSCKISMLDETVTVIYFMFLRRCNWFIYAIKTFVSC